DRAREHERELLFELAQLAARARADGQAPADRTAHRAHDAEVARRAVADEAGTVALPFGRFGELRLRHARQREVVEEDLHELFFGEVKDEVVLALAGVA